MKVNILKFVLFFCVFLFYFILSFPYYSGDVKNHVVWAQSIISQGTWDFFDREFHDYAFPNYPPFAMFLFTICLYLYYFVKDLFFYLNSNVGIFPSVFIPYIEWENVKISFLKLPAILAIVAILVLYLSEIKKHKKNVLYLMLIMLNPAVLYISVIWGQIDLLPLFFIILGFILLLNKKKYSSFLSLELSFLVKQTSLVYFPIFFLLYFKYFKVKEILMVLFIGVVIFYCFYLPFHSFSITWPFELLRDNFRFVAFSTAENAINLWGFIFNYKGVDDTQKVFLLNYNQYGTLLFFILTLPLIISIYKVKDLSKEKLFNILFLFSIIYFFVLTRMHERYLISSVIFASFLVIYNVYKIRYWINYAFFTLLQFILLYRGLLQPNIEILNQLHNNLYFLDSLFIIYLILVIYNLYEYFYEKG